MIILKKNYLKCISSYFLLFAVCFTEKLENRALKRMNIKDFRDITVHECKAKCVDEKNCK